jgi:hypothetical protein
MRGPYVHFLCIYQFAIGQSGRVRHLSGNDLSIVPEKSVRHDSVKIVKGITEDYDNV